MEKTSSKLFAHQLDTLKAIEEGLFLTDHLVAGRQLGKTGYLADQMTKLGKKIGRNPKKAIKSGSKLRFKLRFRKAGPKGQYDRRVVLSEVIEGRIREYHATKGWRSYRVAYS